jgi:Ser/Thr protein kinase RdoA (MazF antagonist)
MFGWTHGDCHHHNSIITPYSDVVLLDFEDTCWQSRMYDLATAIWGTFGRGGTSGVWDALIHGYNSVCRLNDDEAKLIRYLIVARHLWWLGFRARYWDDWHQPYSLNEFFSNGIDLLVTIAREACDLSV